MAEGGRTNTENDEVPGRFEEILCQPCLSKDGQTVADKYCETCNEFQCFECSNVHNVLEVLKSHTLVIASEANTTGVSFDMQGLDQCDKHQEIFKFFCEGEGKLCCSTCAIVDHRRCRSVVEVEKIADKLLTRSSRVKENLQGALDTTEEIESHIILSKKKLATDKDEIISNITHKRNEVIRMFDDLEDAIVNRTDSLQSKTSLVLARKHSENKEHLANVKALLDKINSVDKNGSLIQRFIAEKQMKNEVDVLCRDLHKECQTFETVSISFDFDETLELPPRQIAEFIPGQLTLKYQSHGDLNYVPRGMTLTQIASIDLRKTWKENTKPYYTGVDFLPDGRLVAVDFENQKCLVYNAKLEKVGSFQLSFSPLSVVAVSDGKIAINCYNELEIHFFHVSKSDKISYVKTCQVETAYNSICLKEKGKFVAGTYNYPVPVRIVSFTGEETDFSIHFPNKPYSIDESAVTYIKDSDKVVLTDRYNDTVYIYDIKTNTRVVVKDEQIQEPRYATVGPSDTILVCSRKTNSVVQISQTGRILSSCKVDMDDPRAICISRDQSFLVVANSKIGNEKMQKFKISW